MLRHNKITGARFVMLDAVEVPGTRGNTNILTAVEISFSIGTVPFDLWFVRNSEARSNHRQHLSEMDRWRARRHHHHARLGRRRIHVQVRERLGSVVAMR